MTSLSIPKALREQVKRRADFRCEYCQTSEWLNGVEGEIDHIIPRSEGGPSHIENLCLACTSCNGYKQAKTVGVDPYSGESVLCFTRGSSDGRNISSGAMMRPTSLG